MENKKLIITTSWDDGHPLDLKLAELLEQYGIKGTFYVPCNNSENIVIEDSQLRKISDKFEIGGHTVNHLYLKSVKANEAKHEINSCKVLLQEKIGKEVSAFCFPGGKFTKRDIRLVRDAGFLFARTTNLLQNSWDINRFTMDTSLQIYNHSNQTLIKHCLKRGYFLPIIKYKLLKTYNQNLQELAISLLDNSRKENGIFHLWGHSWEIEKFNLWNDLKEVFKILKNEKDAIFLSNSQSVLYTRNELIL